MSAKGDYSAVVEVDDDLIPETPQLEFQDFPLTGPAGPSLTGSISPGPRSNNFAPDNFTPSTNNSSSSWFSIAYFAQFFDVDTSEVVGRLKNAMLFVFQQDRFIDSLSEKPDFYGPFWLASSVACTIFAVSSLLDTISSNLAGVPISYNFDQIWTSLLSVYGYSFGVPCLLYIVLRYLGANPVLLEFVGVYGYGLISWVVVVILCGIPQEQVRWLLVLFGACYSGLFLGRNVYPTIKRIDSSASRTGLGVAVLATHLAFALFLKIQYLSYTFTVPHKTPVDDPTKGST